MKRQIRAFVAILMILTAALGLAGGALALPFFGQTAPGPAETAFEGRAYHGDPAKCVMTAAEARTLAAKLGELMAAYNDNAYKDGFIRRAALVDMGAGVPALIYFDGESYDESPNDLGPGYNGSANEFTEGCSAWQFVGGVLERFQPGWFYDGYVVYENLSGNGRSGGSYVVPIENGVVNAAPDEDGYFWMEIAGSVAWYEWYLGTMGENYADAYEDMNAGPNNEYEAVLQNPGEGSAVGIFETSYKGLEDAALIWQALGSYAAQMDLREASDPTALMSGYGDVDISALTPELLRGYAQTLRTLPAVDPTYYNGNEPLYNFATLLRGGDGTVLLWVIPAVMSSDWWGQEQYFTRDGASFVGRDHLLFGWDGANVTEIAIPGVNEVMYWPEGVELQHVYYGTDVDGQNWQALYAVEHGGLAAQPLWCHAGGWLYSYALWDDYTQSVPQDFESRKTLTMDFFNARASAGEWPALAFDWNTFTTENVLSEAIDFEVSGGDYQAYRQAHEVYNAEYDYTYLDTSAAGSYRDIETMPDRWLMAADLADRLDAWAESLEKSNEPPVADTGDDGTDAGDGETGSADSETGKEDETGNETGNNNKDNNKDNDRDSGKSEDRDIPVGLLAGVVGGALLIGGGAGTAAALISRSRRKKPAQTPQSQQVPQYPQPPQTPQDQQYSRYQQSPQTPQTPQVPQPQPPQAPVSSETPDGGQAAFCPNCGAPHDPGKKFCSKCGTKL